MTRAGAWEPDPEAPALVRADVAACRAACERMHARPPRRRVTALDEDDDGTSCERFTAGLVRWPSAPFPPLPWIERPLAVLRPLARPVREPMRPVAEAR